MVHFKKKSPKKTLSRPLQKKSHVYIDHAHRSSVVLFFLYYKLKSHYYGTVPFNRGANYQNQSPDSISNFHLKHLLPQGIQAITNISNYTYAQCLTPNIWKQGRIIKMLKSNKDPTTPPSYRPITLLCTPWKITERLIPNIIHPDVPLAPTQHGFQPLHSTNTSLTNLTQYDSDGINSKRRTKYTFNNNRHQ